jgi:signal transduction histidine kinase
MVGFVVVAIVLLLVLVGSTVRQQRRFLRSRERLGGRLLVVQDEERAAIARELHDDTVRQLAAVVFQLRQMTAPGLSKVTDELAATIEELRGIARGLHPGIVDSSGLDVALAELCRSAREREGITVAYAPPNAPEKLLPKERLALFRVAQEAIGNVARHAGVSDASVWLTCDDRTTRLVIEDQGRGFDQGAADSGPGIGITSMGERLAILGGTLELKSSPGSGTRVTAMLPRSASAQ